MFAAVLPPAPVSGTPGVVVVVAPGDTVVPGVVICALAAPAKSKEASARVLTIFLALIMMVKSI